MKPRTTLLTDWVGPSFTPSWFAAVLAAANGTFVFVRFPETLQVKWNTA